MAPFTYIHLLMICVLQRALTSFALPVEQGNATDLAELGGLPAIIRVTYRNQIFALSTFKRPICTSRWLQVAVTGARQRASDELNQAGRRTADPYPREFFSWLSSSFDRSLTIFPVFNGLTWQDIFALLDFLQFLIKLDIFEDKLPLFTVCVEDMNERGCSNERRPPSDRARPGIEVVWDLGLRLDEDESKPPSIDNQTVQPVKVDRRATQDLSIQSPNLPDPYQPFFDPYTFSLSRYTAPYQRASIFVEASMICVENIQDEVKARKAQMSDTYPCDRFVCAAENLGADEEVYEIMFETLLPEDVWPFTYQRIFHFLGDLGEAVRMFGNEVPSFELQIYLGRNGVAKNVVKGSWAPKREHNDRSRTCRNQEVSVD